MIAGTILIEDNSIHFAMNEDNTLTVVVCDNMTGKQHKIESVDSDVFSAAICLGLSSEPEKYGLLYPIAEKLFDKVPIELRFIP